MTCTRAEVRRAFYEKLRRALEDRMPVSISQYDRPFMRITPLDQGEWLVCLQESRSAISIRTRCIRIDDAERDRVTLLAERAGADIAVLLDGAVLIIRTGEEA